MTDTKREQYYKLLQSMYGLTATEDDLLQWVKKQNLRVYSHDQRREQGVRELVVRSVNDTHRH